MVVMTPTTTDRLRWGVDFSRLFTVAGVAPAGGDTTPRRSRFR